MAKAVRYDDYGNADVLYVTDVPEPEARPGRVVVAVVAAGINPGEIPVREGVFRDQWPSTFPSGQGTDFAGRVHAIGDGVRGWDIGDEVVGWTDERAAQAEFVSVPADQLAVKPPDVAWEQVAGLGVAGFTAYAAVNAVGPQSGETVVVTGAAGGVGSVVTQLLRRIDVRVLGVASAANADYLRSLGAEPITYGDGLGHRLREAAPDGIDAVIDTFGGGYVELAIGLGVRPERIDTIIDWDAAERFGTKTDGNAVGASAGVLVELVDLIAAGELAIPVAATFPIEDVRAAYEQLAQRHTRGKIILRVG